MMEEGEVKMRSWEIETGRQRIEFGELEKRREKVLWKWNWHFFTSYPQLS